VKDRLLILACLIATGTLLALSTVLAKLAPGVGLSPVALLAWSSLGAAVILVVVSASRRELPPLNARTIEYSCIAGLVSFVLPNLLFYFSIPHMGVSFVALAIAFPPLFTYLGALALGVERFSLIRAAGVALALAGAGYLAVLKLNAPSGAGGWIFAVLAGPILLAVGNLYRTLRWPVGAQPYALAATMLSAASGMLLTVGMLPGIPLTVPATRNAALLISGQIVTFSAQFAIFFVLQKRGGPVYVSLIGAVAATVGVPFAIFILGEKAPAGLMIGGILIAGGIALVIGSAAKGRQGSLVANPKSEWPGHS
jgi:drug/metabolite transporter (DMT)-like permease